MFNFGCLAFNRTEMKNRLFLFLLTCVTAAQAQNYAQLVNPFIGTGGHGHTFPGATAPFGMVQLSPDTRLTGWDGCSGYHYSDSAIYGFSHTHLSGTGCSDFGDILLMPTQKKYSQKEQLFDAEFYKSRFSHTNEKAYAGFYQVLLNDDHIAVKLTASERVGFHEYQFQKAGTVNVVLDLLHRDELIESKITQVNNTTITGLRRSKAWAEDQWVFFRIEFSKPFIGSFIDHKNNNKYATGMAFEFDVKKKETIKVKVSLSAVDEAGATKNMQSEIPGWSFEQTLQSTTKKWNKELGLIQVEGNTKNNQQIFYTALYHCFIQPNIASDIDGRYRGRDLQIHQTDGFTYYSVFSLWDTFRAAHPLYNLVQAERSNDFIKTFLQQFKESGKLPVWELASNETNCMIGYHSASVIADAWAKGIRNYDKQLVIAALLQSANANERGIGTYKTKGYLAIDDESESVSKTLEYAYDDWCISTFLEDELQVQFIKRSESWKNLFDPSTGLMRPRKNGGWLYPFEPREVNNHYTEANAWQYSFFVPHDINGLIGRHGSAEKFEQKLDELFSTNSETTGRNQADITVLICQYAH
jgi:predicted alpha-1,2-mannosidase